MIPTLALREQAMKLLAADTTTLAQAADANVMALVMNQIAPSEQLVFSDLVLATFDGSTPIAIGLNTQPEGLDPVTNDAIIDFKPPAGGFRFETTGVTHLPQTIYGYVVLNAALNAVLCAELFDVPVTLTAVNQRIEVPSPGLRQAANSIS